MSCSTKLKNQIRVLFLWLLGGLIVFTPGCSSGAARPGTPYPLIQDPLAIRVGTLLWLLDIDRDTVVGGPIPLGEIRALRGSMSGGVLALPGGKVYICTYSDGSETMVGRAVSILDWTTWKVLKEFEIRAPYDLAMAPSGLVYVLSGGSQVLVIDPKREKEVGRISCKQSGDVQAIVAAPSERVYVASHDAVCAIDTQDNTVVGEPFVTEKTIYGLGVVSDTTLYLLHLDTVSVLDIATWKIVKTIDLGGDLHDIAVAPNGKAYITRCDYYDKEHSVAVIDTKSDKVLQKIQVGRGCDSIVIASNKKAYVTNHRDQTVSVIDTIADTVIKTVLLPGLEK